MKQTNTRPVILFITIMALAILYGTSSLYASNNHHEHAFTIYFDKTMEGKIILTCFEGCEWDKLEYGEFDEPAFINQDGFTSEDKLDESDFLISITQIRHDMVVEGLKGTIWRELNFSCIVVDQCSGGFNQRGTAIIAPGY